MNPELLLDLSLLHALESCDADLHGDHDEAMRLSEIARDLRARADALRPRLVTTNKASRAA